MIFHMIQKYCEKFQSPESGARTLQTDRRQTDARRHSEREREFTFANNNNKFIRRWDSKRELSLRQHRARTKKYNRLVQKLYYRSTRLCVGTHVYQIQ